MDDDGEGSDDEDTPENIEDLSDLEDEDDHTNLSLASMEATLKPQVLDTLDQIAASYQGLAEMQTSRMQAAISQSKTFSSNQELDYQRKRTEIVKLVNSLHLHTNRIEALIDQLYGINLRIMSLDGTMVKLADQARINRKEFIKEYELTVDEMIRVGQLLNPKPQKESEPTDEETIIETLLGYEKKFGTPIKAKSNRDYITDLGYSHQKASTIVATALERHSVEKVNAEGKTCIKYSGLKDKRIVDIVNGLQDDDTIVITGSAGAPKTLLADAIDAMEKNLDWQTLIIKPYLQEESIRRNWDGYWSRNTKTGKRKFIEGKKVNLERRLSLITEYSPTTKDGIPRTIVR